EFDKPTVSIAPTAADDAADKSFVANVDATLRSSGVPLDVVRAESKLLFNGKAGDAVLSLLEQRTLSGLNPQAEREAHVAFATLFADLGRLRREPPQGEGYTSDTEFHTARIAELRKRNINIDQLDQTISHLLTPDAYNHIVKYLDSFQGAARMAAYM